MTNNHSRAIWNTGGVAVENWMKSNSKDNNIVLSSRIRLARNLSDIPFPDRLNAERGRDVVEQIEKAFYTSAHTEKAFNTKHLWEAGDMANLSYFERHLISAKLLNNGNKSAFIVDKDETVSIMLNEEDHIRLQCITAGLNLEETYDMANKLDNLLEENLDYAFDEKLGYLAACPTNIGTGLRASVMLHLPALSMNNDMNKILNAVTQVGMTVRGLYGEGSKAEGNLYQLSNQVTLGLSEEEIMNNLKAVVNEIINQEINTRELFLINHKHELEDKIFRSLGILRSAVLLNSKECLNLLSNVRMGVEMGIINDVDSEKLNSLLVEIQSATLQLKANGRLSDKERDYQRALLVRERLTQ